MKEAVSYLTVSGVPSTKLLLREDYWWEGPRIFPLPITMKNPLHTTILDESFNAVGF